MALWPRQLQPGQRAAIRFADLRETTAAFTARIEVFGDGAAEIGSYYRLLDRNGTPLAAESDGSYRLAAEGGDSPMAWLEALTGGEEQPLILYVRPLELLSASGPGPSIRVVAQPVELSDSDGLFLTASTDTLIEGAEAAQISIHPLLEHIGLRVEMELTVSGNAMKGLDYTLVAADLAQGIVFGGEANSTTTLLVDSAPAELRLRLRPRVDDRISQGIRFLNLRISSYRVVPENGGSVDLPPALDFTLLDDELPTVQQMQVGVEFTCVLLNDGSVRCWGYNFFGQSSPPDDLGPGRHLGPVAQLVLGRDHICALTVLGRVRCWGDNGFGRATPPEDLGGVAQLAVGRNHSCALTGSGEVRCWGNNFSGQSTPPEALGGVAQLVVGGEHSCALTVSGEVRCWGQDGFGRSTPPDDLGPVAQFGAGESYNCALTVSGEVRCWGSNVNGQSSPPDDLGPVAQLAVGESHSCALTVSGEVRCWGHNYFGQATPPGNLGPVAQLSVGYESCALTVSGQLRCWGDVNDFSFLPPGAVVEYTGLCALLAEGSVSCPNNLGFVSSEVRPGEVAMALWPRQLQPGQRAAIRFAALGAIAEVTTVRIEVFGEGTTDIGSYYRLLDSSGMPMVADEDGSYRLAGGGDPPMAWLEALTGGQEQPLNLYVRPLELLSVSGPDPSIRIVAQRVELVPVPASVVISALPQAILELDPQADATAEFRLRVRVQSSDDRPFGGISGWSLRSTVTEVAHGDDSHVAVSLSPLIGLTPGRYESLLTVSLSAEQVSAASVEITVVDARGQVLAGASTTVRVARLPILDDLSLLLSETVLEQPAPADSVRVTATVVAFDQFGRSFMPSDLRLRVVDTADESEVLVTEELIFDNQGRVQQSLVLTPQRGRDQNLRVELTGVTDAEVSSNTVAVQLIAVEVLGALTVTGPTSPLIQKVPGEALMFDIGITAVGSKGTDSWQQRLNEPLQLQYTAPPGVTVVYEPILAFSGARTTVTVTVTPLPGTNAELRFSVTGNADDLIGVESTVAVVSLISQQMLTKVTLAVSGERIRTVQSGQDPIVITAQVMTEYFGGAEPEETILQLIVSGSNGVGQTAPIEVVVPAGGFGIAEFTLMLGSAAQSTLSFEVVGLPTGAVLDSPVLRVYLSNGLLFTASTDTLAEGAEAAQLSIWLPPEHTGLRVEVELAVSGNALEGLDYTLVAAPGQGIVFGGEVNSTLTLRVDSAPAEPLNLRLRPRVDDRVSQGIRFLNLRISSYRVISGSGGTVDLPPALAFTIHDDELATAQLVQVGLAGNFACVLLNEGSVRCGGSNSFGRATPPDDLGPVAQIGLGSIHGCALTVSGEVRCWGQDGDGQSTPPDDLDPVAQLAVGSGHSCALTVSGEVRCWGQDEDGQSTPPNNLGPVTQLAVGNDHSCALTVSGRVRCWGSDSDGRSTPPGDLGSVEELAVGDVHSCALTVSGRVRCWGSDSDDRSTPPDDLGSVAQLAVGGSHSCALTVGGEVRCWGSDSFGRSTPPADLGSVAQLVVGSRHSCALTVSDQLRCWGDVIDVLSLPPGMVMAVSEPFGSCALLAEGSVYCPSNPGLVPPELRPGEVAMSVWQRQLEPGQRAGIYFADLRETTGAFTVQIEVFGEGTADVSSYYRLFDSNGTALDAEEDGSYRLEGDAWLEALSDSRLPRLYVRPLELLSAAGLALPIRMVAQPVELRDGLFFTASTNTLAEGAEGAEAVQLSIFPLPKHIGLRVEVELAVSGTAMEGLDYTLVAAGSAQGIVLGGTAKRSITLRVDSVPTEPLRLLLRPRADDYISQGIRFLNLRISSYRVVPENGGSVDLPAALDFTLFDDEPPVAQDVQVGGRTNNFACVLLNDGSVRCGGSRNRDGSATPPDDLGPGRNLGPVVQLSVGSAHSCVLTVSGEVRCWGLNRYGQATPPDDLGPVAQIGAGGSHSCALTVAGGVRCWGRNDGGFSTPPDDLGAVAQLGVGGYHTCALTVLGRVRCWGQDNLGQSSPPEDLDSVAELSVGTEHSCALQRDSRVRCWRSNRDGQSTPPEDLGPVAQIGVGSRYSCALTVGGEVRCWGYDGDGRSSPPDDLGPVAQLSVGQEHSCAVTVSGELRCWGALDDFSFLPPGAITAIDATGRCVLLADSSVYCPNDRDFEPPELSPGDVAMSVSPRQLEPGQRAAIRFADLRETAGAFTARIEVFGYGAAEIGSYYRLLDRNGTPMVAEEDGSYRLVGGGAMAWLEALAGGQEQPLILYVRPLELLSNTGPAPSIRMAVQPVELIDSDGLFFNASIDTLAEGVEEARLSIWLPPEHIGSRVEVKLAVSGTAMEGLDYTLVAADSVPGIVLGGEVNSTITLLVESAPAELRLRLRPRADDRISQGIRFLNLRISGYQVVPGTGGTVDLPAALDFAILDDEPRVAQDVQVGQGNDFACVLLNDGSVGCTGSNRDGQATPPDELGPGRDLGPVAQLAVGNGYSCALTVSGRVHCWGSNTYDRATPPDDLGSVAQVVVGRWHSCALTETGRVRCWGADGFEDGRSMPPDDLGPVAQLAVGNDHSCALTELGAVHCWGWNNAGRATPPDDLGPVAQLAVGNDHSCALTELGAVHCWGWNNAGRATPPGNLGAVAQIVAGSGHTCALTASGEVRCWGSNEFDKATPPGDLPPVAQLVLGDRHSCALTVSGQWLCWGGRPDWGGLVYVSSLPPGSVTAVDQATGSCALLADGSVYCPNNPDLAPPELRPGEVAMSVWPRQLEPGQRAAIHFADLRETVGAFTARIEVFGDGAAEIGSYYRLLDRNGTPLAAETDGSYRLVGDPRPMAWLEALTGGQEQPLILYVRPLELLSNSGPAPSIRIVAQPVELSDSDGLFFTSSIDTLAEGVEEARLSIWLPPEHIGLRVEVELAVSGTAMEGLDYTLVAAESVQGIVLGGEVNSTITLLVESAPAELRLRLRPRADDHISQGDRFLNLRISRYQVVPKIAETVYFPPALDFTIRDDEPRVVQDVQVGIDRTGQFACVLLNDGSMRCTGSNRFDRATPPYDLGPGRNLGPVAQLAVGSSYSCALTVSGEVRCWGYDGDGQSTPPADLGRVAQLAVGSSYSCALTVSGEVRCWGYNQYGQSTPPNNLPPAAQLSVGGSHNCALTVSEQVRCWGDNRNGEARPPNDLGRVAQVAVGGDHSCALTVLGEVRCWGSNGSSRRPDGRSTPPEDLGPVEQLEVGGGHNCVLTVSGRVRCWGSNEDGQSTPPNNLPPAAQLMLGRFHSCALTVLGQLRCWGAVIDVSSLPPGSVTAVDATGSCALLADGSVYCPSRPQLVPPELRPGEVVMGVWQRQLEPGQRAAIRFADLRDTAGAFTARIEVFGDGAADLGSYYRLLDRNGTPVVADADGSYRFAGGDPLPVAGIPPQLRESPPIAWLEALAGGQEQPLILLVRPLELLSASGSPPSIRRVAQSVELIDSDGLFFTSSIDTLAEGGEEVRLSIWLPPEHIGLRVEVELAVSSNAMEGLDYTLAAADTEQGIVLGGDAQRLITLRVASAPTSATEPLRLLLRPRADDGISQGDRFLNLRISSYQVVPEIAETVALPPALDFTISDDEPPTVQQVLVGGDSDFACFHLNGGLVRCWGSDEDGRATPPEGLGSVARLSVGNRHSCALTVSGRLRCWGSNSSGQSMPPADLAPVTQLAVGGYHSCALTLSGQVHCWGADGFEDERSTPPDDLGPVAQVAVGGSYSCAVTVSGRVRCWGYDRNGESSPPNYRSRVAQLAVGLVHSCALTVSGEVRCWGSNEDGQSTPPADLGSVAQIGVGRSHTCALTVLGRVRCWGENGNGQATPPADLGSVAQVVAGNNHSCALTNLGELRCWGALDDFSFLPPGSVTAVDASSRCALLAEGSVYCPNNMDLVPPELRPGEVVMSVWQRQLQPGQRAAIRFTGLRESTAVFTARIEVFGDGAADIGSYYRLLDRNGSPLAAETDGSYRLEGGDPLPVAGLPSQLRGSPPMAWLEALAGGQEQPLILYVRPLGLLSNSGPVPSIRRVAQSVELIDSDGLFFTSSIDALTEGGEEVQLSIWLPPEHIGLRVEMELAVSGIAMEGLDYTLVAADSAPGIVLGGEAQRLITLRVDSAPAELRLRLRPRADDRISQGDRFLSLRISGYQVVSKIAETVALPPALEFTIRDDEPPTAQQVQVGWSNDFACFHLNGGSVRCAGNNRFDRATPPEGLSPGRNLGSVAQLSVGRNHSCALTVSGEVRCWGENSRGRSTPLYDLGSVAQVAVGDSFACALTVSGQVRCWGGSSLPDNLGRVAQLSVGRSHSCAVSASDRVSCWGSNRDGQARPPRNLGLVAQVAVGGRHSCAVTVSGSVRCWGENRQDQTRPPNNLRQVAQVAVGEYHSCALTNSGRLRCWGDYALDRSTPPDDLGPFAQLSVGWNHSCAVTISGELRCWGAVIDISFLPPGSVTAVDQATGSCALLAEGSVICPGRAELVPPELRPGEVVMSVWQRQLLPGQRAAIRFTDLRESTAAFTARIEVFGDESADIGSYYRLLDRNGTPLAAEPDGSYRLAAGGDDPPMAWLEALVGGPEQPLVLYVRPLELLSASGPGPSIRVVAQRVELVLMPASVVISVLPQASLDLHPRAKVLAEFRVRAEFRDLDGQPLSDLNGLSLRSAVTEVVHGDDSHVAVSLSPLIALAPGRYESRLTVSLSAGRVSAASVEVAVVDAGGQGLAGVSTTVQLVRLPVLDDLSLQLSATVLEQPAPGDSVQTMATVVARDQFGRSFIPSDLRLRVVDTADQSEVLVTEELVFDAQGEAQSLLVLTPPRGRDQNLRVELTGVTDASSNTVSVRLIAAEVLGSLMVTGPASTQTQTTPAEAVVFEITVTAVGSKGTQLWQPSERLRLQHITAPGVTVDYEPILTFSGGVATVTVTATPLPDTEALITFSVAGDSDSLAGVPSNAFIVSVVAAEVLGRVVLTVLGGAEQFILTDMFSIATELSLEPLGNRPLSAATALTVLIRASVDSGGLLDGPAVFSVPISGVTPGRVGITGRLSDNSFATAVRLSIDDGVPAGVPTVILPTATVTVIARANMDVDGSGQIDVADGVLMLQYIYDSLAKDTRPELLLRLQDLLHPEHPDRRRLDLNGNGVIDAFDARILLRYLAGLRNGALRGNLGAKTEQQLIQIMEANQ